MKHLRHLNLLFIFLASILISSCSDKKPINIDYSIAAAKDINQNVNDFYKVKFSQDNNLDLGFYEGEVWIKLYVENKKKSQSLIVLFNDLINHNYRFYKLNSKDNTFISYHKELPLKKYDDRSYNFARPNFQIDLEAYEKATFLITTSSDGRVLQATPRLISLNQFQSIKQQMLIFDIVFYFSILLLLLLNLFYFRLVKSSIYYYYGAYVLSGCLMYLFIEGKLYGIGMSNVLVDHFIFISIRIWILTSLLFTLKFLETKTTNLKYYKFIIVMLTLTLGGATIYQLLFYSTSISNLHRFENNIGFVWVVLLIITIGLAYKKRKIQSIYYLMSYSAFLFFATLGLIDSHMTILPGDPFFYIKIGTILEFIGFTYFITVLVKQKFIINEKLEKKLSKNISELQEKEKLLATKNFDLVSVFKLIENSFSNEADWNNFKERFKVLNPNFVSSLSTKHPNLTKSELRLLTLIRIGYSQKEIANILSIAPDSVKKARSRARKKLNLEEHKELNSYIKNIST